MRFFEFTTTLSSDIGEIKSDLDTLSVLSIQDPEVSNKINAELRKLIIRIKEENREQNNQDDIKIDQNLPQEKDQLPNLPNQITVGESWQDTRSLIAKITKMLSEDIKDKARIKEYKQEIKKLVATAKKEAFSELNTEMVSLMSNLKQLPSSFSKLVMSELIKIIVANRAEPEVVFEFLQDCASPERIIDMPTIVKGSKSTGDFIIPQKYKLIIQDLARLIPPGSNASAGKGELILTLIGKDTTKPLVGDIFVGDKKIEVKASDISGSGVTDFVFGKQDVKSARTIFVDAVNKAYGKPVFLDQPAKVSKNGISGISSINRTDLKNLQPMLQRMGYQVVKETFRKMFVAVGLNDKAISEILGSFNTDSTLDFEKYSKAIIKNTFDMYKKQNKHDGLLTINVKNLSYTYTESGNDFVNLDSIQLERLFDFRPTPSAFTSFKQKT